MADVAAVATAAKAFKEMVATAANELANAVAAARVECCEKGPHWFGSFAPYD